MNRRGFTLIELLATLAVLGIITGIVLVSSTSLFKDKKSDTEDVFVDTLKDAIKIYIDELGGVELNGDPVCTIEKSIHPNGVGIGIYEVKNEVKKITFEDITNSKYKPLTKGDMINPANKVKCNIAAEIHIYADSDFAYYYKFTGSELGCLSKNTGVISNLPCECLSKNEGVISNLPEECGIQ
ncbi:MAG: type II secretion system GspH family protein [Erysipelotrichaceae bacterium]|nr:type II secretion system GspH family protein [Erysipelotrichaceae bacterium]